MVMDLTDCEETTGIDDPSTLQLIPSWPTVIQTIHVIQSESIRRIQMVMDLTDCEETTGIDDPITPDQVSKLDQRDPNDPCDPIGINTTDTDGDGLNRL